MSESAVLTGGISLLSAIVGGAITMLAQVVTHWHERRLRAQERRDAARVERKAVLEELLDVLDNLDAEAADAAQVHGAPATESVHTWRDRAKFKNRLERLALRSGSEEIVQAIVLDGVDLDNVTETRKVALLAYMKLNRRSVEYELL